MNNLAINQILFLKKKKYLFTFFIIYYNIFLLLFLNIL